MTTHRVTPVTEADRAMAQLAKAQALVRLADGRVGRLQWWAPRGPSAKVIVSGRRERVPKDSLTFIQSTDIGGTS